MKKDYNVIGLMSGTSMDGLDIALCRFNHRTGWQFEIINAETIPYSRQWLHDLNTARELGEKDLEKLSLAYGSYLANCVNEFIDKNRLTNIDFIASHGHTIHHQPQNGITVQIGDGNVLSEETKLPVVYDFRIQDVQLGGQGAPLVPIGDQLLFSKYQACLNLGGFSNISFQYHNERIAFDISPINIVLNRLTRKIGKDYDFNGELAASGKSIPVLLKQLNALEYYKNPVPKSLGIEWVEKNMYPLLLESYEINDMLFTVVEHVVFQINQVFIQYHIKDVLVTGGGAYNSFFMDELSKASSTKISVPDDLIVEYKEALIFAFMGVLRMENRINVLKSVTGSLKDHCSGKISQLA